MSDTLQKIRTLLRANSIDFREVEHKETFTSEESAAARGEDVRIGGKALLVKVGDTFSLFVMSAALKLDSKALKSRFETKKIRFASADELKRLTGLVPGSVPPFGRPILDFDLYADRSVVENERIAFNAGSLTNSIIMSSADYIKVAAPDIFSFAAES